MAKTAKKAKRPDPKAAAQRKVAKVAKKQARGRA